jgi:hypothetical protein
VATRLREEVPVADNLPDGANEVDNDDNEFDDGDLADILDDSKTEEAAVEQRALMASLDTQHCSVAAARKEMAAAEQPRKEEDQKGQRRRW